MRADSQVDIKSKTHFDMKEQSSLINIDFCCEVHGKVSIRVPAFMQAMARCCPGCVEDNRKSDLAPIIKKAVKNELASTGIPENYIGQRFSSLDYSKSQKQQVIVDRLVTYVRELVQSGTGECAKNILLSGNMGTGKTLYASIILQEILNRSVDRSLIDDRDIKLKSGLSVFFVSESELLNEITAIWKSNTNTQKKMIKELSKKSILCIDDVGSITSTSTHLLDFYITLIDERYKRRLPTIITSNLKHDDLKLAIGARSSDRFFEKNRVIVAGFDWDSYRSCLDDIEFL